MWKAKVLDFEQIHGRGVDVRRFVNFVLRGGTTPPLPPTKRSRRSLFDSDNESQSEEEEQVIPQPQHAALQPQPNTTPVLQQGTPPSSPQNPSVTQCEALEDLHTHQDTPDVKILQDGVWKIAAPTAQNMGILIPPHIHTCIVKSIPTVQKPTKQISPFALISERVATTRFAATLPDSAPRIYSIKKCDDGNTYLIMEFAEGQTFEDYIKQHGDLTQKMKDQVHAQIVSIADASLSHDDLNMENLIWNPATRQVRLIDFGKASEFKNPSLIPKAIKNMTNNFHSQLQSVKTNLAKNQGGGSK